VVTAKFEPDSLYANEYKIVIMQFIFCQKSKLLIEVNIITKLFQASETYAGNPVEK